ncbi:MAG: D-TA family PLP-dependent enzyme [Defluviitaleaceae bacterium]|nr:D-TA family PLP-dependent enzyme [Defluviitaleaceae bacterium]
MTNERYVLSDSTSVDSPSLLYYPEIIQENIGKAIEIAGGAQRLWPHVKTHKLAPIVLMQQHSGIERFKCATVAEAEMLGAFGARHVMLAYPVVGPSIPRFITLMKKFPDTAWWAVGDNENVLEQLNRQTSEAGLHPNILIDVNMGMNRTGVLPDALEDFYLSQTRHKNLNLRGLHGYDGHITEPDPAKRKKNTDTAAHRVLEIRDSLQARGLNLDTVVMGGTPTFPCHALRKNIYLSPGTLFVNDYGYASRYIDLPFIPAAALLTRVISHPAPGLFTLDLGYKAISSDPQGVHGIITSLPHATPVSQSEEHWVFNKNDGILPAVGDVLYIIPTHICTTAALYDEALVVHEGKVTDIWHAPARKRRITI